MDDWTPEVGDVVRIGLGRALRTVEWHTARGPDASGLVVRLFNLRSHSQRGHVLHYGERSDQPRVRLMWTAAEAEV